MRQLLTTLLISLAVLPAAPAAGAADAQAENASCMGLGASFYGQFAPQQMAFVVAAVNDAATAVDLAPGTTYSFFAGEKEGGALPAPCGTRLE